MSNIEALIATRGKTHGRFEDHARCSQRLKSVIQEEVNLRVHDRGQPELTDEQYETLGMIMHKVGRIVAGDANFQDHWDDIAGYAKLCSKSVADEGEWVSDPPRSEFDLDDDYALSLDDEVMEVLEEDNEEWTEATMDALREMHPEDRDTLRELLDELDVDTCLLCGKEQESCPRCEDPEVDEDCQLDGRNCPPDHGHQVDEGPIDQSDPGDETTYIHGPGHIHRWHVLPAGHLMQCKDTSCGELRTIVDQQPGQYALNLTPDPVIRPALDTLFASARSDDALIQADYLANVNRKHPCNCREMDRCRVDNGNHVGNNVFCCKAEGSR